MANYSGVVSLRNTGELQATGVLLWTGRHILTVAHFLDGITDLNNLQLQFNSSTALSPVSVKSFTQHPGWENNPANYNHDLAIIELASEVDPSIARYDIYRSFDELSQVFSRVGYSKTIDPNNGGLLSSNKSFHSGTNSYDVTTDVINTFLGTSIAPDLQLSYDFDNGLAQNDAYGQLLGLNDLGTGATETFSRSGDSGGPAFINQQVAGIASFIFHYDNGVTADVTPAVDSTYGEMASDTRVSKYANWIDSVVEPNFVQPLPAQKEQVDIYPIEGTTANTTNYFLLQIGTALSIDCSVNYETINGAALSGSDFVYTSGVATIPAGETKIAIAVEIIADSVKENNENFSLKVTNPQGGVFPAGVDALYAEHTIIDDDHAYSLTRSYPAQMPQDNAIELIGFDFEDTLPL